MAHDSRENAVPGRNERGLHNNARMPITRSTRRWRPSPTGDGVSDKKQDRVGGQLQTACSGSCRTEVTRAAAYQPSPRRSTQDARSRPRSISRPCSRIVHKVPYGTTARTVSAGMRMRAAWAQNGPARCYGVTGLSLAARHLPGYGDPATGRSTTISAWLPARNKN
jgi:hypothetical protein